MSAAEATALRVNDTARRPVRGTENLFSWYRLGELELSNRMVLSPKTRSRAIDGNIPNPIAATYYVQRASAVLLITEGTQVSPQGVGYIRAPGLHSPAQVAGWRKITDAVHQAGGTIFAQLWHVGRVSHPDFHNGALPIAPSALEVDGEAFTSNGKVKIVTPRALELHELPGIVSQFQTAAENAKVAGFDGVELHGANGYLLDQFLRDGSNRRDDRERRDEISSSACDRGMTGMRVVTVRCAVSCQFGSARALPEKCIAQSTGARDFLCRRRDALHRLSSAGIARATRPAQVAPWPSRVSAA
jgi:NADH:flavin oxidoreductase / NADH oxidase family